LIRALAVAVRSCPTIRLEVAGDGPSMPEVQGLISELGLQEQVRLLGQVREIPELLTRAGIFVLPSQTEGISLTVLEAMASGLPVVATRVGGNPEVVEEDVTGLLVPPADSEALAAALVRLWNDPAERMRFGRAGRLRVEEHFDVRGMVARYERLYEDRRS
jgi:glycosyltransferase involved in cell wall biosynthesis